MEVDGNGKGIRAMHGVPTSMRDREWGTVKWYDRSKGFGFVVIDDEEGTPREVFVHSSAHCAGPPLIRGERVLVRTRVSLVSWSSSARGAEGS